MEKIIHTDPKCDIDKNCGAYDYVFQNGQNGSFIILKYKRKNIFRF